MSALSKLYAEIAQCQRCEIARSRTHAVPGEGAEDSGILFIGEAPGYHEDQLGRPFVGPAGQLLDRLLASIALGREQVYIANVIKCRPPGNRDPLPVEISNCRGWLEKQIELISPRIVVTLGRYSMAMFFPGRTISKIHGTAQVKDGVIYFAMYHPAAALHQQSLRGEIEADMKKIPALLADMKAGPGVGPVSPSSEGAADRPLPQPEQLKMFEV